MPKKRYCACDNEWDCAITYNCGKSSKKNTFHLGDNPENELVRCRLRHRGKEVLATPLRVSQIENFKTFELFKQLENEKDT